MSFSLSAGTLASLHAGYVLVSGRPGYINPGYDTYVGLRGTLGRTWTEPAAGGDLAIALETLAPEWDAARKRTFSYSLPQTDAYAGVYGAHFLRAMFAAALEGRKPPVTAEDAVKVLRIIEAAYESSASGKTVML